MQSHDSAIPVYDCTPAVPMNARTKTFKKNLEYGFQSPIFEKKLTIPPKSNRIPRFSLTFRSKIYLILFFLLRYSIITLPWLPEGKNKVRGEVQLGKRAAEQLKKKIITKIIFRARFFVPTAIFDCFSTNCFTISNISSTISIFLLPK